MTRLDYIKALAKGLEIEMTPEQHLQNVVRLVAGNRYPFGMNDSSKTLHATNQYIGLLEHLGGVPDCSSVPRP